MKKLISFLLIAVLSTGMLLADISFTLRNNSLKSIPLKIPGVMNPNLSPMSNSGVTLAEGQKIFFYIKKKKYLLLVVDEKLEGKTLFVDELIKKRKLELN